MATRLQPQSVRCPAEPRHTQGTLVWIMAATNSVIRLILAISNQMKLRRSLWIRVVFEGRRYETTVRHMTRISYAENYGKRID